MQVMLNGVSQKSLIFFQSHFQNKVKLESLQLVKGSAGKLHVHLRSKNTTKRLKKQRQRLKMVENILPIRVRRWTTGFIGTYKTSPKHAPVVLSERRALELVDRDFIRTQMIPKLTVRVGLSKEQLRPSEVVYKEILWLDTHGITGPDE